MPEKAIREVRILVLAMRGSKAGLGQLISDLIFRSEIINGVTRQQVLMFLEEYCTTGISNLMVDSRKTQTASETGNLIASNPYFLQTYHHVNLEIEEAAMTFTRTSLKESRG